MNFDIRNHIYRMLALFVCLVVVAACKKTEDDRSVDKQEQRIKRYLTSNNIEHIDYGGLYKAYLNVDPVAGPQLQRGDSLYFYFAEYDFYSKVDSLYYTNIEELAKRHGFDLSAIDTRPHGIKYGYEHPPLLKGIEQGLNNSREGDSVMLYMTSDYAYQNKGVGILEKNSSIAVFLVVYKIKQ